MTQHSIRTRIVCSAMAVLVLATTGCLGRNYDRSLGRITIPDKYESPSTPTRDVIYVVDRPAERDESTAERIAGQQRPVVTLRSNPNWTTGASYFSFPNGTNGNFTFGGPFSGNMTHPNLTQMPWTTGNMTFADPRVQQWIQEQMRNGGTTFAWPGNANVTLNPNTTEPNSANTTRARDRRPRIRLRTNPNVTR